MCGWSHSCHASASPEGDQTGSHAKSAVDTTFDGPPAIPWTSMRWADAVSTAQATHRPSGEATGASTRAPSAGRISDGEPSARSTRMSRPSAATSTTASSPHHDHVPPQVGGVRRAAGETAARLNAVLAGREHANDVGGAVWEQPLKENIGHSRLEVLVGSLIGPLVALPGLALVGSPLHLAGLISQGLHAAS